MFRWYPVYFYFLWLISRVRGVLAGYSREQGKTDSFGVLFCVACGPLERTDAIGGLRCHGANAPSVPGRKSRNRREQSYPQSPSVPFPAADPRGDSLSMLHFLRLQKQGDPNMKRFLRN